MEVNAEILETIQRIISLHAGKYKIPGYDTEDIAQEAFIMALEALKAWKPSIGPFENFLSKHLYFRLRTFVRDKTLNDSIFKENKKQLLSPLDISLVNAENEKALIDPDNVIENVEREEILKKIDDYLPIALRADFLRMRDGVKINRGRAKKIKLFIMTLIQELTGDNDEED